MGIFKRKMKGVRCLLKGAAKKLVWTPEADSTFQKLKIAFTTAPVLKHSDPSLLFVVEVRASEMGVGAVQSRCSRNPCCIQFLSTLKRSLPLNVTMALVTENV